MSSKQNGDTVKVITYSVSGYKDKSNNIIEKDGFYIGSVKYDGNSIVCSKYDKYEDLYKNTNYIHTRDANKAEEIYANYNVN